MTRVFGASSGTRMTLFPGQERKQSKAKRLAMLAFGKSKEAQAALDRAAAIEARARREIRAAQDRDSRSLLAITQERVKALGKSLKKKFLRRAGE